jgi:hypothetical protein
MDPSILRLRSGRRKLRVKATLAMTMWLADSEGVKTWEPLNSSKRSQFGWMPAQGGHDKTNVQFEANSDLSAGAVAIFGALQYEANSA